MYVCKPCAHRGKKRMSDPVEPELLMTDSHQVSTRTQTWVLCKGSKFM